MTAYEQRECAPYERIAPRDYDWDLGKKINNFVSESFESLFIFSFYLLAITVLVKRGRFKGNFTTMKRSMLINDIVDKQTNSNRPQLNPYMLHPFPFLIEMIINSIR